ncbi:hypothetical protein [Holospora curviuscula]|uniref:Uncharacterized protein n=1 Tax=Holospora curviuscula TaxID=1082868 RepID=A0A2S5R7E3_9PROT|nr:hypothetical protein [Holospora curviuscula]PPE03213.1 hypothetical protein HCUR_01353 [Holospora curviuscula]
MNHYPVLLLFILFAIYTPLEARAEFFSNIFHRTKNKSQEASKKRRLQVGKPEDFINLYKRQIEDYTLCHKDIFNVISIFKKKVKNGGPTELTNEEKETIRKPSESCKFIVPNETDSLENYSIK